METWRASEKLAESPAHHRHSACASLLDVRAGLLRNTSPGHSGQRLRGAHLRGRPAQSRDGALAAESVQPRFAAVEEGERAFPVHGPGHQVLRAHLGGPGGQAEIEHGRAHSSESSVAGLLAADRDLPGRHDSQRRVRDRLQNGRVPPWAARPAHPVPFRRARRGRVRGVRPLAGRYPTAGDDAVAEHVLRPVPARVHAE